MAVKLITYDLRSPGQDYKDLHETIKALSRNGAWWHYLESTWVVPCDLTCGQVMERLKPTIDTNDRVLVLDITGDSYQGWLPEEAWDIFNSIMSNH